MKANELRIGNLVYLTAAGHKDTPDVLNWDIQDYEFYEKRMSDIEPIPLTEEWLLRFGFEYAVKKWRYNDGSIGKSEKYILPYLTLEIDLEGRFVMHTAYPLPTYVYYVHQLQNLYFALTGEELETTNP